MDIEEEGLLKGSGKSNYFQDSEHQDLSSEYTDDDAEDMDEVFFNINQQDMTEEEALNFLANLPKKRTWAENKHLKAAQKKDRRHFDSRDSRQPRPNPKRKLSIAELKKVTKCAHCQQRGHWREECPNLHKPKVIGNAQNKNKDGSGSAFVFLRKSGSGSADSSQQQFLNYLQFASEVTSFLEVPPGYAIVDPGASQDLVGLKSFNDLQKQLATIGLKTVKLDEKPPSTSGIGGSAEPLPTALSPCILGGMPGVLKLVVIEQDVPQLLSFGLLEHALSVIDTGSNTISFKAFGTQAPLMRLSSGHRALNIAEWKRW